MNFSSILRPVATASFSLLATAAVKAELLRPVEVPGQAVQQSPDAFATSMHAHCLGLLCQQVRQFGALADDWDGYGAVAPSEAATSNVLDLLSRLPGEWVLRLPLDGLTPTPYGTITLEWALAGDYLSVEVGDTAWSYTAEAAGRPQLAPATTYPNPELLARVQTLLDQIFPDAAAHNGFSYTA